MRCPICEKTFAATESTALPFCSERCRTIDLGRWLGETYGIPVASDAESLEAPADDSSDSGADAPRRP